MPRNVYIAHKGKTFFIVYADRKKGQLRTAGQFYDVPISVVRESIAKKGLQEIEPPFPQTYA